MSLRHAFAETSESSETPERGTESTSPRGRLERPDPSPYRKDFDARMDEVEAAEKKKAAEGGAGGNPPRDDGSDNKEQQYLERQEPATSLDGKIRDIPKEKIPETDVNNFKDGKYRTVEAAEDITAYRVYGRGSQKEGAYLTTQPLMDRMDSRLNLALLPEWKNSREQYCEVTIPKGTVFQIGHAAGKTTKESYELPGGAEQILVSPEFVNDASHYGEGKPLGFHTHYSDFDRKLDELGL